jgi:hypothetical protein
MYTGIVIIIDCIRIFRKIMAAAAADDDDENEEYANCDSYCDVYGVCYATTSKVGLHVTSDVSIATQWLRIPRQPNC